MPLYTTEQKTLTEQKKLWLRFILFANNDMQMYINLSFFHKSNLMYSRMVSSVLTIILNAIGSVPLNLPVVRIKKEQENLRVHFDSAMHTLKEQSQTIERLSRLIEMQAKKNEQQLIQIDPCRKNENIQDLQRQATQLRNNIMKSAEIMTKSRTHFLESNKTLARYT